jgi:sodium/bile acid cotransporter 7
MKVPKLKIDNFLLLLILAIVFATIAPIRGTAVQPATLITNSAIVLLFFLHGAKLSRKAVLEGLGAWQTHLAVLTATFVMFPILGLIARQVSNLWLPSTIGDGVLLLCLMPSTVQSSIAFTALGRGNVPTAVCSAAASNVLGVMLTPILVALFMTRTSDGVSWDGVLNVASQLLAPFLVGHFCRPLILNALERHRQLAFQIDRSVILLVVYTAFSAAVVEGLWKRYSIDDLAWVILIDGIILALALMLTTFGARAASFTKADEITIVFCGSKKSLASGVPIAGALFPPAMVGPLIVPLMLFHQIQLMVSAVLAQRYAARMDSPGSEPLPHANSVPAMASEQSRLAE